VLAALLRQRWNQSVWDQIGDLYGEAAQDPIVIEPSISIRQPRQVQRRLPEAFWDQLIDEYLAGASATSLEKKHGVDDQTIRNHLKARGITPRPQKPATFTVDRLTEVADLRAQGVTLTEIGRRFGVTRQAVSWALNNAAKKSD
jgi:transposase-like protein